MTLLVIIGKIWLPV